MSALSAQAGIAHGIERCCCGSRLLFCCCLRSCQTLQMAIVLSLESVEEFLDYWGDDTGHITWRLTPSEVKAILGQRGDFNKNTISALPL